MFHLYESNKINTIDVEFNGESSEVTGSAYVYQNERYSLKYNYM